MDIKIGQTWRDKDKRRLKQGIISNITETHIVVTFSDGTTKGYAKDRFTKRWELVDLLQIAVDNTQLAEAKPAAPKHKTREQWLQAAVKELTAKVFKPAKLEVPEVRVSVGWPGGRGKKQGVVGQCFPTIHAEDHVAQIFVSPAVSDPLKVIATLTHEIVHAIDDCESGHKGSFVRTAKSVGFLPKWTSIENRNDELNDKLKDAVEKLGAFPHAALSGGDRPVVQKTYMVLLESLDCDVCENGYKLRMTQKWLDEVGTPLCPHAVEMVPQEK